MNEGYNVLPKISIIVPVYNAEPYLPQCIDSILSQAFSNFELLLIDDGSSDSSSTICDDYAQRDSRVVVFHKTNRGVSSARNIGLENARGEWIYFADADDIVDPHALETLNRLISEDVDLVMAGYNISSGQMGYKEAHASHYDQLISCEKALHEMYKPSDFVYQGFLWCKLFRASVIKQYGLKFHESIRFNEDRLFIVEYLCKSKRDVAYTTKPVYNYIPRRDGAMGSIKRGYNKDYATDFDAYVLMYEAISKSVSNRNLQREALTGIAQSYLDNHRKMLAFGHYDSAIHKRMFKALTGNNALVSYLKLIVMPFVLNLGLLILPKQLINIVSKRSNRKGQGCKKDGE